jgi:hypothetical protein
MLKDSMDSRRRQVPLLLLFLQPGLNGLFCKKKTFNALHWSIFVSRNQIDYTFLE